MKIKSTKQPVAIKNVLILLGLLAVLVSVGFFTYKNAKIRPKSKNKTTKFSSFLTKKSSFQEVLDHYKDHTIFFSVKDEASFKFPQAIRDLSLIHI